MEQCHCAVEVVKVVTEPRELTNALIFLWMATCGWARLLFKAMSDETPGVLLPGEGSPPGHSREA